MTNSSKTVVVVDVDELVDVEIEDDVEVELVVDVEVDVDVVEASDEVVAADALVSIACVDDVSDPSAQATTASCDATSRASPHHRCALSREINGA